MSLNQIDVKKTIVWMKDYLEFVQGNNRRMPDPSGRDIEYILFAKTSIACMELQIEKKPLDDMLCPSCRRFVVTGIADAHEVHINLNHCICGQRILWEE